MHFPKKEIVRRYSGNPIITKAFLPIACRGVYNSSVVKFRGAYKMLMRVESPDLISTLWQADSADGYHWTLGEPVPLPTEAPDYKRYGHNQYDPRITRIGDTYYITLCMHGRAAAMGLFSTVDFKGFRWHGYITGPGFRNTVLFPEKIGGLYTALERPNESGEIWLVQTPDLEFWGRRDLILHPSDHESGIWASHKLGPCGWPIRTPRGWLVIFHAVHHMCSGAVYHAGVLLLDGENPRRLIRAGKLPILSPEEPYETIGHASNVVFANSQVVEDDGSVKLYYGAADTVQCVADTTIDLLLEAALER